MKIKRGSDVEKAADELVENLDAAGATITVRGGIDLDETTERGTGPMTRREMELLRDLESVDRSISREQAEKKRIAAEYNEAIKSLEETRDSLLSKIEEVRHGQGDLFDPTGGEEVRPDDE